MLVAELDRIDLFLSDPVLVPSLLACNVDL